MDRRFIIILAVIILGFFGIVYTSKKDKTQTESSTASAQGSSNYYGKMDSQVELTEFVDFQCEACYAYYPVIKEVKEKYKDKVKFRIRNFPITSSHQFAMQAARSAEAAARQGKFFEMHDLIFEGQKTWERAQDPTSYFDGYAQQIGLDMDKYKADFASPGVNAVVNQDLRDVQELGGNGTPTFALNGKKVESPGRTVDDFSKFLDAELAKVQQ